MAIEVTPVSSSTTTRYATVPTSSRSCDAPLRLATRTATIPGARAGDAHVALALAAPPPSSSVSSTNLAAIPNTVPNAHASNAFHPPRTPTTVPPETRATTDSNRNPPRGARRASNSNAAFDRDDPAVTPPPRSSVPPSRRATSTRDTSPSAANVAASVAAFGGPHVTSADDTHRAGSVDAGSELDDDAHQHHVPGSRGRFAPTTCVGVFANPSAAAATDGYSEYVVGSSRTSSCASGELANARARDHVALDAERPAGPIARA